MSGKNNKFKIIFIGWNENGEKSLELLLRNHIPITSIILPKGYETSKMKVLAEKNSVPYIESDGNPDELYAHISSVNPDLTIVASFHKLLQARILTASRLGTINIHASALPAYRGYHPINWAIINDERSIGVTIHFIDNGMDSGDILAQKIITITDSDDVNSLRKKLTTHGARLLLRVVKKIIQDQEKPVGIKQSGKISFAPKRLPDQGRINWDDKTRNIFNLVRSLRSPYPNAFALTQKNERISVEKSFIPPYPGVVLAQVNGYYLITTSDGVIMIKTKSKLTIGQKLT